MYDTPLVCVHRAEREGHAVRAYASGRVPRHRAKLGLTNRSEAVNVADKVCILREFAREGLVDEVLKRVKKFAALASENVRVRAVDVESATVFALVRFRVQVEARGGEDIVQELLSLLVDCVHRIMTQA